MAVVSGAWAGHTWHRLFSVRCVFSHFSQVLDVFTMEKFFALASCCVELFALEVLSQATEPHSDL